MNQHVTENVKLDKFAADLNLEIVYAGRGTVTLSSMSVERPGLALAGFFDYFDPTRVVVLGFSEHEYLRTFTEKIRRKKIAERSEKSAALRTCKTAFMAKIGG